MATKRASSSNGPSVGIEFREVLSGDIRAGKNKAPFQYDFKVRIPDLYTFTRKAHHETGIGNGTVRWQDPRLPNGKRRKLPITEGKFEMFRKDPKIRKMQHFHFTFTFRDESNEIVRVRGRKDLFDDSGFDAARDLTTVFVELDTGGAVFAKGTVRVHLGEFIQLITSMRAIGGTKKSRGQATSQFYGFMNNRLRQIYKHVPLIFRDDARLSREEWKTLKFATRIMLPDPLPPGGPTADDVVKKLEDFVAHTSSGRLRQMRFWLQQFALIVPVNDRDIPKVRGFIRRELQRPERSVFRDVFALLHQIAVLPYYSHRKADKLVRYKRPDVKSKQDKLDLPVTRRIPDRVYDVAIAGSGPAGSVLAARLAAQGKSVLVLEAGPYTPERSIQSDELKAVAQTYKDSGLQRANEQLFSNDPGFFILQGGCVGGGGLVNNAVCFMLPKDRQAVWRNAGFPLSEQQLLGAFKATGAEIAVGPISAKAKHLNPAVQLLEPVFGTPTKPNPAEYPTPGLSECLVNMEKCISLGLCNVGCGAGRKRNALQVHLKAALKSGNCTLVPDAEVTDLTLDGRKVSAMHVKLRDGKEVTVRAKEFVLSCGPIGSASVLLRTNGIGKLKLPIGDRFSANVGAPMFAFNNRVLHERATVQIAHYYWPESTSDGFVIESWYNPPGANAAAMPGFFDEHHYRMLQYDRTVGAAPLVGTDPKGRIRMGGQGDPDITLPIRRAEISKLRRALVLLAQSFIEGGAESALAGFGDGFEMHTESDVAAFDRELARLESDSKLRYKLTLGTGHPQGGAAMSDDAAVSVVDGDFRVRGLDNLRVCDGSVFPDVSSVNPQWTIMALAHLCGEAMA